MNPNMILQFLISHASQLLSLGQQIGGLMNHPNTLHADPAVRASHNSRIDSLIGIADTAVGWIATIAPLLGPEGEAVAAVATGVGDVAQVAQSVYTPPQAAGVPVLGVVIPAGQEADPAPTS